MHGKVKEETMRRFALCASFLAVSLVLPLAASAAPSLLTSPIAQPYFTYSATMLYSGGSLSIQSGNGTVTGYTDGGGTAHAPLSDAYDPSPGALDVSFTLGGLQLSSTYTSGDNYIVAEFTRTAFGSVAAGNPSPYPAPPVFYLAGQPVTGVTALIYGLNDGNTTVGTFELLFELDGNLAFALGGFGYDPGQVPNPNGPDAAGVSLPLGTQFVLTGTFALGLDQYDQQLYFDTNLFDQINGPGSFDAVSVGQFAYVPVPEPCTLLLLAAGVGLWTRRRRV
ncbi:MAG: hypothetical protein BIFFINMI_03122 [Phycisphaerae bacterium]|nr:hypothetical protein [Phycisphaerae bacterium]